MLIFLIFHSFSYECMANLNHGTTFKLEGSNWTPVDSNGKYNTTYLPLRSVAEAVGMDVVLNQEKLIIELKEKVYRKVILDESYIIYENK